MTYPTLLNYIEAVATIQARLKTLPKIKAVKDNDGTPLYRTKGSMALFTVVDTRGIPFTLGVFLNKLAREKYSAKQCDKLYRDELYVHHANQAHYYDIIIRSTAPTMPLKKLNTQNQSLRSLCEGLRAFKDERNKWGYQNENQQTIITPQWDFVDDFSEGRALVEHDGYQGLINSQGAEILPAEFDELSWDNSRYAYGEKNGLWGAFDRQGNTIVPLKWEWISEFGNGYAIVQQDNKYGFVDTSGKIVIIPKYDDASSFNEHGYAKVTLNEQEFFIDSKERRL